MNKQTKSRVEATYYLVFGAVIGSLVGFTWGLWKGFGNIADLSDWVQGGAAVTQAVGSIAAIWASGWIAGREHRRSVEMAKEAEDTRARNVARLVTSEIFQTVIRLSASVDIIESGARVQDTAFQVGRVQPRALLTLPEPEARIFHQLGEAVACLPPTALNAAIAFDKIIRHFSGNVARLAEDTDQDGFVPRTACADAAASIRRVLGVAANKVLPTLIPLAYPDGLEAEDQRILEYARNAGGN